MTGNHYFFEKRKFKSTKGLKKDVYYEYKGYLARDEERLYCPIVLHFARDEIFFLYIDRGGRPHKIFTLPVAEGELNQERLSQKIESYWKMPLWKPKREDGYQFFVEKSQTSLSYFLTIYGISIERDSSEKDIFTRRPMLKDYAPFDNHLRITIENSGKRLKFSFVDAEKEHDNYIAEIWSFTEDKTGFIQTKYINFRKLFLDFLYELEFASTFEDENFLLLQPILQNNKLIFGLTKKSRFYHVLTFIDEYLQDDKMPYLPKEYRKVEKAWLNVCFSEQYKDVFVSRDSVFLSPEDEVKNVIFNSNVRLKNNLFTRAELLTKDDIPLSNQASTFFLRRYLIFDAFDVLMPRPWTFTLFCLFAMTPFSDYLLGNFIASKNIAGTYTVGMPIFMLGAWIWYYLRHKINLFKLVLPRLFLGILIGWAAFWGAEESWKSALIALGPRLILLDTLLLFLLYLYVFTDIRNKLVLISDWQVAKRAFSLVSFAMIISLVQGHYVIQFKAKTMIENSGFLEMLTKDPVQTKSISILKDINDARKNPNVEERPTYATYKGRLFSNESNATWNVNNYAEIDFSSFKIIYLWSVLFSQFLMSILIGIILQLIWEDRPITEPL